MRESEKSRGSSTPSEVNGKLPVEIVEREYDRSIHWTVQDLVRLARELRENPGVFLKAGELEEISEQRIIQKVHDYLDSER